MSFHTRNFLKTENAHACFTHYMIYNPWLNFKELNACKNSGHWEDFPVLPNSVECFLLGTKSKVALFYLFYKANAKHCNKLETGIKLPCRKECDRTAEKCCSSFAPDPCRQEKNFMAGYQKGLFTLKMATLFHLDPFLAVLPGSVLQCFHCEHFLT